MVVHHPNRLHESVTDSRTGKLEPPPQQFLAHRVGFHRPSRNLMMSFPGVHLRGALYKLPDELVEAAEFVLYGAKCLSVPDGRMDFEAVSDDPRIQEQRADSLFIEPRQLSGVEVRERLPV